MIRTERGVYALETRNTSYCFRITGSGFPEHLYYGRKIHLHPEMMAEKRVFAPGNTTIAEEAHPELTLEDICLEMSSSGKGDVREPFLSLVYADGSRTSDFRFRRAEITEEKPDLKGLPSALTPKTGHSHLAVTLTERCHPLDLELHYTVYEDCDVITRSCRLINRSSEPVRIERLMSLQLDLEQAGYVLTSFHGRWAGEMEKYSQPLLAGSLSGGSRTGTSSNRTNPFFMLSEEHTTEEHGSCFGFNLIYSGNHLETAEVGSMGKLRILSGIHPDGFAWNLAPGESFDAPEAVMTFSDEGFGGMSRRMHRFVRTYIVRGFWARKGRPILLNSWEASYFDISERKLLRLASAARSVGIELFVMDDGWFAGRNDDTTSLGDWTADPKKLPGGIAPLAEKVRALGLDFGIWVEPEMISEKSDLYQRHPEWAMEIPGQPHAEGRHQKILDLTNPEVQDYVIEEMSRVFSSAEISYVKWDMNRNFSDVFSQTLPPEKQGEVSHRYVRGLYRCMQELTERFPRILFEGCASGGNRFDLGILCFFPQIWASDNTDALCRAQIQTGYSYGYPMNTVTAHVSDCPNHQTLRTVPLHTRFGAAAFGVLGYECNLCDMSRAELSEIKEQIRLYKKWRSVLQFGTFYRVRDIASGTAEWCTVSRDRRRAVSFRMAGMTRSNMPSQRLMPKGLRPDAVYGVKNVPVPVDIKDFGSLVNTVSPVHIRNGSLTQQIASKVISMPGETEKYAAWGDTLMHAGIGLSQPFRSTGLSEQVSVWKDFESRLYLIEELKQKKKQTEDAEQSST